MSELTSTAYTPEIDTSDVSFIERQDDEINNAINEFVATISAHNLASVDKVKALDAAMNEKGRDLARQYGITQDDDARNLKDTIFEHAAFKIGELAKQQVIAQVENGTSGIVTRQYLEAISNLPLPASVITAQYDMLQDEALKACKNAEQEPSKKNEDLALGFTKSAAFFGSKDDDVQAHKQQAIKQLYDTTRKTADAKLEQKVLGRYIETGFEGATLNDFTPTRERVLGGLKQYMGRKERLLAIAGLTGASLPFTSVAAAAAPSAVSTTEATPAPEQATDSSTETTTPIEETAPTSTPTTEPTEDVIEQAPIKEIPVEELVPTVPVPPKPDHDPTVGTDTADVEKPTADDTSSQPVKTQPADKAESADTDKQTSKTKNSTDNKESSPAVTPPEQTETAPETSDATEPETETRQQDAPVESNDTPAEQNDSQSNADRDVEKSEPKTTTEPTRDTETEPTTSPIPEFSDAPSTESTTEPTDGPTENSSPEFSDEPSDQPTPEQPEEPSDSHDDLPDIFATPVVVESDSIDDELESEQDVQSSDADNNQTEQPQESSTAEPSDEQEEDATNAPTEELTDSQGAALDIIAPIATSTHNDTLDLEIDTDDDEAVPIFENDTSSVHEADTGVYIEDEGEEPSDAMESITIMAEEVEPSVNDTIESELRVIAKPFQGDDSPEEATAIVDLPSAPKAPEVTEKLLNNEQQAVLAAKRLAEMDGGWQNRGVVMKVLIEQGGLRPMHAAALVGGAMANVPSLDPDHQELSGGSGRGIAGWGSNENATLDRFGHDSHTGLVAFAESRGTSWDDLETQALYMIHELNTTQSDVFAVLKNTTNLKDAAQAAGLYFEKPDDADDGENRITNATLVADTYDQQLDEIAVEQTELKQAKQEAKEQAKREAAERRAERKARQKAAREAQQRREAKQRKEAANDYHAPVPAGSPASPQYAGHTGIDYAVGVGTPFYASTSGTVDVIKYNVANKQWCVNAFNNIGASMSAISDPQQKEVRITTNIDGDRVTTIYAHMSSINVKDGQHVEAGQRIGATGDSGCSTGPHAHYEVRVNSVPVSPDWLRRELD